MKRKDQSKPKCIYKNRLGKNGEERAKNFMLEKGYKYLCSNYRYDRAEIDLIFTDEEKKIVIFIEVKTRRSKEFGEPEESVTPSKQNQIRKAAMGFILDNENYEQYDLRIDVICIFIENDIAAIDHIENAF
jgi:putative endonuclease